MPFYLGIDCGKDGALAVLSNEDPEAWVIDTPTLVRTKGGRAYDEPRMRKLLLPYAGENALALVELQHSRPGEGVKSVFSLGEGYGLWRGLLVGLGIPYQLVTPQAWKKVVLEGLGLKDKAASYQVANRLYPKLELTGPRGGLKDGRCDAVCIAQYGLRTRT